MSILKKIIADKQIELNARKSLIPLKQLERSALFERPKNSLNARLSNSVSGIIAEYKRRSPSKAVINQSLNVEEVVRGYEKAGACGISVLTDQKYFGGSIEDLVSARASCNLPLLRKEFIIDPYQITEAKAYGADVILLIASVLSREDIKNLSVWAQQLEMEVLLEVHNKLELVKAMMPSLDMIGVNNRNLKTFEVDLQHSRELSVLIPDEFVKVSESGIGNVRAVKGLQTFGYRGFLIGENFMKTNDPGLSASEFIKKLKQ
ncbi:MAG: indole-3-glycerol phosphate synthase TrpC [Bacteroidota bacterium]|nr:indole-3-glycerol phosphate synthase TrpC [Bacteroidota bacterium]